MYRQKVSIREKIILVLYILLFATAAFSVASLQPHEIDPPVYSCPPDETARYLVPKWIYEHGTIPTGLEPETKNPIYGEFSYAYLPGLSYIVMGYTMRAVCGADGVRSAFDPLLAARYVNVIFGILSAFFIWLLGRRIFNKERYVWLFAIGVSFLPQYLFIHTYVNTESLCLLSIAVILHALVCMHQDGVSFKNSAGFAIGAAVLTLSYYNAYGILLFSIPIFISYFSHKNEQGKISVDIKSMFKYGLSIVGIWCVLCLWWFIRQGIALDGDFLGLSHRNDGLVMIWEHSMKTQGISFMDMLTKYKPVSTSRISFIANYGSCSILGYPWIYVIYELFYLIGLVLIVSEVIARIRESGGRIKSGWLFLHLMLLAADVSVFILWIYYCYSFDYQPQGRYMFPALFHIYWLLIKGYEWMIEKRNTTDIKKNIVIAVLSLAMIAIMLIYVYGIAVPIYMADI